MSNDIQVWTFDKLAESYDMRTCKIDNEDRFCLVDVCKALGLTNPTMAKKPLSESVVTAIDVNTLGGIRKATFVSLPGVLALLSISRKPNVASFGEWIKQQTGCNLEVVTLGPEQSTISIIKAALKHSNKFRSIDQYSCGGHRIDLYFPNIRLAVECDEHGHVGYDPNLEVDREMFLRHELGCNFVRYNPDERGFNIGNVISEILQYAEGVEK